MVWGATGAVVSALGGTVGGLLAGLPLGYLLPLFGVYVGATPFLLGAGFSLALARHAPTRIAISQHHLW